MIEHVISRARIFSFGEGRRRRLRCEDFLIPSLFR
jgi:hypothetical protein